MHTNGSPLSVAQRPNSEAGTAPSAVGFLLLDSLRRPISFNAEALQVLSYPDTLTNGRRPDVFLAGKIRETLTRQQPSHESPFVTEFRSGRRRYRCRAFLVDSNGKGSSHASIAVLLERAPFGVMPLSPLTEQFNLTRRERDALEYLLQGLSNKEIATRMNVSPNTVKAFLRLIMLKMEVSSRAAIVAKIMMTNP
jgi:DNA-binding CsgD family transcriptional regulator